MKKIRILAVAVTSTAVMTHSPAAAQEIPSETWMGVYLGKSKVGYARFHIDEAEYLGRTGYRLDSQSKMKFLALGVEVEQNLDSTVYLNKEFEPLYQEYQMSSAGHTTTVTARFKAREIVAEVTSDGTKSTSTIPIPTGSRIVGDSTYLPNAAKLKVGDKLNLKWFNPLSLSLDDLQTEVLRKETIEFQGKKHQVYVIKSLTPLGEMTCWQNENGDLMKVTALIGINMVREPKEIAQSLSDQSGEYTPPSDLALMTLAPTTADIPEPRQVEYMRVKLSGLADKSLVISDRRQRTTFTDGEKPSAEYRITASRHDPARSLSLPINDPAVRRYLDETPYVQPKNSEIAALAKEIAGRETNSGKVVTLLRAWVNENMQSKGDIGIVRSSVDVLHAKTGVCRDYAVLYTALARAAGIPTKLVAGLVYWKGGFYYHAWAESYVGQWIPIDPTLPTDFVDATHIKLAEGDASAMFDMVKTMGTLGAEVIEFR